MKTKKILYGIITAALLLTMISKSNATVNASTYAITIQLKEITTLIPVQGATIVLNNETKLSDSTGMAIFNVPAANCLNCVVKYYYTISKYGYNKIKDSILVKADKLVAIIMKPIIYNVVFIVSDGIKPILGAKINFDNKTINVNSAGMAEFLGVKMGENLPFIITRAQYKTIAGTLTVTDNMSKTFYMTPEGTNIISFFVKRTGDGTKVAGSEIIFNNDTLYTDTAGRAIFANVLTGETKVYKVYKDGYNATYGTVTIDTDIVKTIFIDSLKVSFMVSDGTHYIRDAEVSFNGTTSKTSDSGLAVFKGILSATGIEYTVEREGYTSFSGKVDVFHNNVDVTVIMILKDTTGPGEDNIVNKTIELNVYPNPVRGDLFVSSSEELKSIQVISILGQTVKTINRPAGNITQIETADLRTGMYLIRVIDTNNKVSVFRIIKE